MQLLELPSGMVSLEYAAQDQVEVSARLKTLAAVSVTNHATYSEVKVGDEAFLHMSDWDEPCMIAQSEAGNAILRRVCAMGLPDSAIAAE
ncbi:hypothetical protein [Sphingomonas psychrolutea]|uniref:Uncharacterized protein n=1 Tax=Sphingomonas psychrolutea TaxID=1259676 RepID=A0ABQ1GBD2_9SPHN|nr:hypothetical protein [Sphingomonas psychrolutea]GGA40463.1 hypothetical protein GCM10011395_08420 [Sphingomonas psychrolutea]